MISKVVRGLVSQKLPGGSSRRQCWCWCPQLSLASSQRISSPASPCSCESPSQVLFGSAVVSSKAASCSTQLLRQLLLLVPPVQQLWLWFLPSSQTTKPLKATSWVATSFLNEPVSASCCGMVSPQCRHLDLAPRDWPSLRAPNPARDRIRGSKYHKNNNSECMVLFFLFGCRFLFGESPFGVRWCCLLAMSLAFFADMQSLQ